MSHRSLGTIIYSSTHKYTYTPPQVISDRLLEANAYMWHHILIHINIPQVMSGRLIEANAAGEARRKEEVKRIFDIDMDAQ